MKPLNFWGWDILTAFWQIDKDQIEVFSNTRCLEPLQTSYRACRKQPRSRDQKELFSNWTWRDDGLQSEYGQISSNLSETRVQFLQGFGLQMSWEGLAAVGNERELNRKAEAGTEIPFSNSCCPEPFSNNCFSSNVSIGTTKTATILASVLHYEGMSGTIHRQEII